MRLLADTAHRRLDPDPVAFLDMELASIIEVHPRVGIRLDRTRAMPRRAELRMIQRAHATGNREAERILLGHLGITERRLRLAIDGDGIVVEVLEHEA